MNTITKEQARQFILAKQGLIGEYRFAGKEGAYAYVRQAGCIQYDPVDVCGKNAELTLQSRVKGFRKDMLRELLYKDRLLVDYADKELSIWPTEDWPYFSSYRDRSRSLGETFEGLEELKEQALDYIEKHGPVCSDSLPIEGEIFWHSSMHWSGNWQKPSPAARSVLEQLYTDGELIIHHKQGSRKYYDLAEKYISKSILKAENPCKKEENFETILCKKAEGFETILCGKAEGFETILCGKAEEFGADSCVTEGLAGDVDPCGEEDRFLAWRVLRRIGAVGLLWDKTSTAFLGLYINAEKRKAILQLLTERGAIRPVMVEGMKIPFYYRAEDDALLRAVIEGSADLKPRMAFVAPLDPLMWDKALVQALWDFQYSWEIYTPAVKRKYGYYTLPILYGDRFVGRIDTAADRKEHVLRVKGLWWEPGVRQTKKLEAALNRALQNFAKFNECTAIEEQQ